jgi:hypothetical protein
LISGEAKSPAGNRASIPITQAPRDRHATASTEPVAQSTQRVRITTALRAHARMLAQRGRLSAGADRQRDCRQLVATSAPPFWTKFTAVHSYGRDAGLSIGQY